MLAIQGIRLDDISISKDDEGKQQVKGSYSLISTADKVLAKQTFNGYNDIEVVFSSETQKLINDFVLAIKKDVQTVLGLEES